MEIKDPMYKPDDYVVNRQGDKGQVVRVRDYNFDDNEYTYIVKLDEEFIGEEPFIIEFEYNLEPCQEPPKTVWDLEEGDTYYSIYGNGNVSSEEKWFDNDYENNYREIGNVFITREEAEFEAERRKIETEMLRLGGRRNFKFDGDNYGIFYCEGINVVLFHLAMYQGIIYFDTRKEAEDAIEHIGKDRIKKYIFGVNE
ncbi:hypothetical protein ACTNED_00690 [Absicoccus porci]|uniref:hypothetical protein n=1 Tax=Absicoccus porci TaxID=2486576 RepID=UPI003F8C0711